MRHRRHPRQGTRPEGRHDGRGGPGGPEPRGRFRGARPGQRATARPPAFLHHRKRQAVNGAAAVARYTLVELSRRRILLVFFIIGALGIALIGIGLKVFASAFNSVVITGPNGTAPDPAKLQRAFELSFVNNLIDVLGFFSLLIAFGIGMTVIYHDLDSGAAVSIFSKPVSRAAFTAGKLAAAIVGVLGVEARLMMFLFGTGNLGGALWIETVTQVANAVTVMLLVMALST